MEAKALVLMKDGSLVDAVPTRELGFEDLEKMVLFDYSGLAGEKITVKVINTWEPQQTPDQFYVYKDRLLRNFAEKDWNLLCSCPVLNHSACAYLGIHPVKDKA